MSRARDKRQAAVLTGSQIRQQRRMLRSATHYENKAVKLKNKVDPAVAAATKIKHKLVTKGRLGAVTAVGAGIAGINALANHRRSPHSGIDSKDQQTWNQKGATM